MDKRIAYEAPSVEMLRIVSNDLMLLSDEDKEDIDPSAGLWVPL